MTSGVYIISNLVNGKRYIGSAVRLQRRLKYHRAALARSAHPNRHLQASWNKHGAEVFQFQTLLICKPENLLFYEQLCLDGMCPEFNILPTAGSALGYSHTPAAINDFKSRRHSEQTKQKIAAANRKRSPEVRERLRAAKRAWWATQPPEARQRMARLMVDGRRK